MPETRRRSSKKKDAPTEALGFEEALGQLEGAVTQLEDGDLELEEALAVFEKGVGLTRNCAERLEESERRIEVLVAEGEALVERPFEEDEA
jgi:exodeoxyribonuclease VII small subunit